MFKKILIANRGEIACRVIKTARKMGIATVAVYSEADKDAMHVTMADESVCIGPPPSKESYLVMDKIIAACKQTGAEAVHPGYGFLSENATFSRRLEEEGIVFIGPKHYSVEQMGDKIASKKLALAAKVNVIPGYNDAIDTPAQAVEIAKGIAWPSMTRKRTKASPPARPKPRTPSATIACSSRSTSRSRATSRSRCWATPTATRSTCTSASARSSAATRR